KPYKTARESLMNVLRVPSRLARRLVKTKNPEACETELWALRDVSFEVQQGEVVGIIGRNGAGKSTLLKVLSRITEPTSGRITIRGRVGSLLEVGTGFHPELTGRENLFLNGAILGMRRTEIIRKFDEIVAFAEIDKFIDTPVKHYSSGMYMRLAFSVAAHLQPEILLVDEVLAVGDAEFQKRCMGKMGEVARGGSTVLFVSHNMGAVSSLCTKVAFMKTGQVVEIGEPAHAIGRYQQEGVQTGGRACFPLVSRRVDAKPYIKSLSTIDVDGAIRDVFLMGDRLRIETELGGLSPAVRVAVAVELKTSVGITVLQFIGNDENFVLTGQSGDARVLLEIREIPLYPGKYLLSCWIGDPFGHEYDYRNECLSVTIQTGSLIRRSNLSNTQALVYVKGRWDIV
ncbi:MAG: ABC transporter ATP-binding protein, partial [Acidobacteria bacterium]